MPAQRSPLYMASIRLLAAAAFGMALVIGMNVACSSANERKTREQAREAGRELSNDAKKAGHEIQKDAKELGREANSAVQPDKLEHASLLAQVKSKLAADAGLSTLTNVSVAVAGSVVTLSGTVSSEDQKKAAGSAAAQVGGVTQVRNRILVRP